MKLNKIIGAFLLTAGFLVSYCVFNEPSALATDHENLEEGLPTEVEDAYPIAYLGREIQGYFRWQRSRDEKNRFELTPRLEYGLARNLQVSLTAPFYGGDAERTGSGDVKLDALYNFNTESVWLPAFSAEGGATFPSGKHSEGVDTTVKLIASKMPFPESFLLHRIHLNLIWNRNNVPHRDERENYFKGIVGFSMRAGKDTVVVTDFIAEQEKEKHKDANILELGVRRQFNPLTVLAIGVGTGFGDKSPHFRLNVGIQRSISFF